MKMLRFFSAALLLMIFASVSFAQMKDSDKMMDHSNIYTNDDGVAIKGYDPVAYFTMDKAVMGKSDYKAEYKGTTFQFANKSDMEMFKKNPEKYIPKYGGYCATAMGDAGKKVDSDPTSFKVKDGKLYLFYVGEYKGKQVDAKAPWDKNEKELKMMADKNWNKLMMKKDDHMMKDKMMKDKMMKDKDMKMKKKDDMKSDKM